MIDGPTISQGTRKECMKALLWSGTQVSTTKDLPLQGVLKLAFKYFLSVVFVHFLLYYLRTEVLTDCIISP